MKIYSLIPQFDCEEIHDRFYQKVKGQHWKNINTPIEILKEALINDQEFFHKLFYIRNETKEEKINIYIEDNRICIHINCLFHDIQFETKSKTVIVENEIYTKNITTIAEDKWINREFIKHICFLTIETSD